MFSHYVTTHQLLFHALCFYRFQSLLGKVDNVDSNLTAMPHIIQLLEKSSSTSHVKSKVIDIVSNLVNSVKDDQTALITNIGKTAVKIVDSNSDGLYLMSFFCGNFFLVFGGGKEDFYCK